MSSSVHVKEAVLITPSKPTPSTILQLSPLDSLFPYTVEYLMVYKPCPLLNKTVIIERVKAALAQVLVHYYPLAGRVRSRADGSGLEVECKAQGALFAEAVSDHFVYEEFEKGHGKEWRKLLSLNVADVLNGAPPVVVQLTWLSDGATTLAVGLNHYLIDGVGAGEFLNSFAQLAKYELDELKTMPVWDRHLMNSNPFISLTSQVDKQSHLEFNRVVDISNFASKYNQENFSENDIQEELAPTNVTFNKRTIDELKKLATTSTGWLGEFSCTSFEVLAAHVWRSWARAMNLPSNQILKLLFAINVRNRVKPSLPNGYYGNGVVLGCAETCIQDLTEKGLGYATELIKRAKERVDDVYVRAVIESVNSTQWGLDLVGVLIITQWTRLELDKIDFGIGKPVHVVTTVCDKCCVFLPVNNQSEGVKVHVAVPANVVHQYLHLLENIYT